MKDIFVLVCVVALAIINPLLILWALNTVFPALNIPYNFFTWAGVLILAKVCGGK